MIARARSRTRERPARGSASGSRRSPKAIAKAAASERGPRMRKTSTTSRLRRRAARAAAAAGGSSRAPPIRDPVAERVVGEEEQDRERELERDRDRCPLPGRQASPAAAHLVAEADHSAGVSRRGVAHPPSGVVRRAGPRAEDEDQDQDREHDRLGPVGARRVPVEPLVEGLDEPDQDGAEHGAGQVADAAEHGGRERDQPELEALVEAHGRHVERVEEAGRARERAGDQERERDRAVHVDAHDRGRVLVLGGRAHRLALLRASARGTRARAAPAP